MPQLRFAQTSRKNRALITVTKRYQAISELKEHFPSYSSFCDACRDVLPYLPTHPHVLRLSLPLPEVCMP